MLMIFEDIHWIDPTSLATIGRTIDRVATLGVLLIITNRPEFQPPWIGRPNVTSLTINRLGVHEIAAMIDRVRVNKPLPANTRQDIIERTDGIPLFVEEITKAVVEAAGEGVSERAIAAIPAPSVAVPASLHASLMARLDRLGTAKEVAQIGAVIGREFSHVLLVAVAHRAEGELNAAVDRLIAAGLGQGGILSDKPVLSPSDDNGRPVHATILDRNLPQCVWTNHLDRRLRSERSQH